jgi:hypothetical protein
VKNAAQHIFYKKIMRDLKRGKRSPNMWATLVIKKVTLTRLRTIVERLYFCKQQIFSFDFDDIFVSVVILACLFVSVVI